MLHDIDIRDDLCDYLEGKYGKVRFFDRNYVVVGSTHGHHIREHVPEHGGVITVEETEGARYC